MGRLIILSGFVVSGLVLGSSSAAQGGAAFVDATFAEGQVEAYPAAAEAYLAVLAAGAPDRYLRQLDLVLPDSLRGAGGDVLALWWRSRDPAPATAAHEGVIEHRLRVATAEAEFGAPTPTRFDARGDVFVRFGAPARRRVIDFEADLFIARAIRDEPSIRSTDFPRNEAWHYPDLGPDVYFLFAKGGGDAGYQEALTMDLLPPQLLAGGLAPEMASRAQLLGKAMRWIYKDLWQYSSDVRDRLVELDAVVGGDGAAFRGNTGNQIRNEVLQAQDEDEIARRARDEALPPSVTRVLEGKSAGVGWRAARFLDEDGGVTVLVPWAIPPVTLASGTAATWKAALLEIAVVSYDDGFVRSGAEYESRLLSGEPGAATDGVLSFRSPSPSGAVAVEWDLWPAEADGQLETRDPVFVSTAPPIGLAGLIAEGAEFGLSDLLPVDPTTVYGEADRLQGGVVAIPARTVRAGEPVALYYEVYRTGDAPVPVSVEVAVRERTAGGLFRPAREGGGASAVEDRLLDPRTGRLALIDRVADVDEVCVEVTVTSLETSRRTARSICIAVAPSE